MSRLPSKTSFGEVAATSEPPDSNDFDVEARHVLHGLDLRLAHLRGSVRACERHLVDTCRMALCRVNTGTPSSMRDGLIRLHEQHLLRLELTRDHAANSQQELRRATLARIGLVGVIKEWQRAVDCADAFAKQQ